MPGANDEAMRLMVVEMTKLKLDAKTEKEELVAKHRFEKEALVVKYEKEEEKLRDELERCRELAIAEGREPTILDIVHTLQLALESEEGNNIKLATAPTALDLYERTMTISDEELHSEIEFSTQNGDTVLHIAASYHFPHPALSRLVQCGCDINAKNAREKTAITIAVKQDDPAVFDSLALLGADLSVRDTYGDSISLMSESSPELTFLFHLHGLKKGHKIDAGFVSPLKGMATSMPMLHTKSIIKLSHPAQQCIRIMSLEMNQLREEAREREEEGYCPVMLAAINNFNYPLRVLKRLLTAYPGGVNAQGEGGDTALMVAVVCRNVEYVDLLLEMGSCVGIVRDDGLNAFDYTAEGMAGAGYEDEDKRLGIIAIFEKHGVTSNVIPTTFISPLYFESIYFAQRIADANWASYRPTLMCMQEIDVEYRKFGEKALIHLSEEAKCFFKAFACADGTDRFGNGIARLMLTFIGGENMREKLTREPFLDP
jgi:ankyrin repeat protein